MADLTMDKLVALCKNRGLIFAGSELYGGLANTWDGLLVLCRRQLLEPQ